MKTANINIRVEDWLYKTVKQEGINISEVLRAALINEMERKRVEVILKELNNASPAVKKMKMQSIVADIRKARDRR